MLFSFCYPFYYLLFLDKNKKKALHNIFAFNSNGLQIEHIVEKTKCKRKKIKREGPINKSTKIPKYFRNFLLISKRGLFDQISK
jgi:hypothetical protein